MTSAQGSKEEIKPETVVLKPRGVNVNYWEMKGNENICKDGTFCPELISNYDTGEETHDVEVNVLGCAGDLSGFDCANDPDATEYSSSFGNTLSCSDDGLKLSSSDVEVESQLHAENAAFAFSDRFSRVTRKKKLTDHWRRFIRPLMWRCKWIELRMKELHAQDIKYSKELLPYDQEKILKVDMVSADKSTSRQQVMRRQRRKKNEETVDISSYMSNHNIFSYYDRDRKADGLSVYDGCEDQGKQEIKHPKDEWPMLDFRDDDSSLESILLDIESLKSRIFRMKVQLINIAEEISTSSLSIPIKPPYSPTLSPDCSSDNNVSSYGDPAHPNIIDITMDLLSSAAGFSLDQHQLGGPTDDVLLVNNQVAEEELQYFNNVRLSMEEPEEETVKEKLLHISPAVSTSETETDPERVVMPKCPVLEACSRPDANIRRGKRKRRMERKISPNGWKCPVLEPCSHPDADIRRSKRKRVERKLSPGWNGEKKVRKRKSSKVLRKPFV